LYPAFKNTIREYKVTFYNPSKKGDEKVTELFVEYGTEAVLDGKNLKKIDTINPSNYEFDT
jgi:hypothetical protein